MKTIPLSRLESDPAGTLRECADSGQAVVVELPDHRLLAIHPVDSSEDDSLTSDLLENNGAFQELVARSARSAKKPFRPSSGNV